MPVQAIQQMKPTRAVHGAHAGGPTDEQPTRGCFLGQSSRRCHASADEQHAAATASWCNAYASTDERYAAATASWCYASTNERYAAATIGSDAGFSPSPDDADDCSACWRDTT